MPSTESVSHRDLIVCACGDQEYTAHDAIDAVIFRGELDAKWKEFLETVEAEKRSEELDLDLDQATISSAVKRGWRTVASRLMISLTTLPATTGRMRLMKTSFRLK